MPAPSQVPRPAAAPPKRTALATLSDLTGDPVGAPTCAKTGCPGPLTGARGAVIDCGCGDLFRCPFAVRDDDGFEPEAGGPAMDAPAPQVPMPTLTTPTV